MAHHILFGSNSHLLTCTPSALRLLLFQSGVEPQQLVREADLAEWRCKQFGPIHSGQRKQRLLHARIQVGNFLFCITVIMIDSISSLFQRMVLSCDMNMESCLSSVLSTSDWWQVFRVSEKLFSQPYLKIPGIEPGTFLHSKQNALVYH